MSWCTQNLDQKICLTCQHFKCGRRLKTIGRFLVIEYDSPTGNCRIHNNFPTLWNVKVTGISSCHYKRWTSLPDKD